MKYNYTYFPMVQDWQLFIQILLHSMYHSIHESNYVSLLGWIQQNIILWVAYMQQFVSNSSRRWEVHDQGTGFDVWWRPTFWFTDGWYAVCPLIVKQDKKVFCGLLYKALISFMRTLISCFNHLPKTFTTLGIRFKNMSFSGTKH